MSVDANWNTSVASRKSVSQECQYVHACVSPVTVLPAVITTETAACMSRDAYGMCKKILQKNRCTHKRASHQKSTEHR